MRGELDDAAQHCMRQERMTRGRTEARGIGFSGGVADSARKGRE